MARIRKREWTTKTGKHTCWEINYVIDGKQYRKSGYKSQLEAQIDLPNVIIDTSANTKLSVIIDDYMERHCKLLCKPSTQDLYKTYKKVHLQTLQNKIAKEVKKRDIENLMLEMKQKGISNKAINGVMTFIQAVFNYGVEAGYYKVNPIGKIKKLPQEKKPVRFLNEKQMQAFLECAKIDRYYALFATAIYTGMRRGELLALEWSDIDFKNAKINVSKQYYKGIKQSTKTNKARSVDIPPALLEILKEHKQNCNILTKFVFHNMSGGAIHAYYMEDKHFHPLLKECNKILDDENQITNFRFHDLRHTYATYLLSKNIPIKYVQSQLGHSSAKMTLDVYASVLPSIKNDVLHFWNNLNYNEGNSTQFEQELSIKN